MAPVPLQKQEQKKPPKNASIARFQGFCCYRIRSEIRAVFGAWVRQRERARRGRLRTGHGPFASGLPKKRRQPAAARPAPIRVASRKPKAPARPATRAGLLQLGRAFPGPFPQQAQGLVSVPANRSNPASGRVHGPGSTTKTGAEKAPLKTPPSHGFRGFAAIESGAKLGRFPVRGFGN